jgi:hypothetical protein
MKYLFIIALTALTSCQVDDITPDSTNWDSDSHSTSPTCQINKAEMIDRICTHAESDGGIELLLQGTCRATMTANLENCDYNYIKGCQCATDYENTQYATLVLPASCDTVCNGF